MLGRGVGENVVSGHRGMAEKPRHPVLAGWIAGSLEIVVTYPLEFVKTQLQLQVTSSTASARSGLTTCHRLFILTLTAAYWPLATDHWPLTTDHCLLTLQVASSALYSTETRYTGTLDCISRTVRGQHGPLGPNLIPNPNLSPRPSQVRGQHGPLGLYQGGASWLVAAGPRAAVRFGSFGALSDSAAGQALRDRHGRAVSDLAAGLFSGALEAALVQTPNQAVQVKMVHDQSPQGPQRYRSLLHAVSSIQREFGFVKGFLGGMGPTVLKVPPSLVTRP